MNFQVTNFALPNSAPNRADYIDVWGLVFQCQLFRSNVRFRCSTDTLLASVLLAKHSLKSSADSCLSITASDHPVWKSLDCAIKDRRCHRAFREPQDAHGKRLIRISPGETGRGQLWE